MPSNQLPFNRIIVIDDEPMATFLAEFILKEANLAHQIDLFNNPEEALLFLRTHYGETASPGDYTKDLILLDLHMPVMNGFELLEALQTLGQQSLICQNLVVLSSSISGRDRTKAASFQVRDFLTKPLTAKAVLSLTT